MWASTMSTSERGPAGPIDAQAMAGEIERLANQFFSAGVPGPAMEPTSPALGAAAVSAPGAIAPPSALPYAMNVGAGGASPAVVLPPIPGPAHRMPLAATPPPKEADSQRFRRSSRRRSGSPR